MDASQGSNRKLKQDEPDSEEICINQCVTVVRTEDALRTAVKAGASHIEVREHMNLTTLEEPLTVPSTVQSIQVRACGPCDG